jgi:hypothetical protein
MPSSRSALAGWTPQDIERGRRWVEAWRHAGTELERIHRDELRGLDGFRAIALLCGPADYSRPPRAPRPTSGLVEQQRLFVRLRRP